MKLAYLRSSIQNAFNGLFPIKHRYFIKQENKPEIAPRKPSDGNSRWTTDDGSATALAVSNRPGMARIAKFLGVKNGAGSV